jgi:hypothetical protein
MSAFVIAATVVVVGAGIAGAQSAMAADAENNKLAQQQAGLQIQQGMDLASTLTRHVLAQEELDDENRRGRMRLTGLELQYQRELADSAVRESGTVGATALALFQSQETKLLIAKGNALSETEANMLQTGKEAQEGLRVTQNKMNESQSRINMSQANKTSGTDQAINATLAGVQGGLSNVGSGIALGSAFG